MLRDHRQVALNQVVEAALEAAHVHERGAELLDADPELGHALRTLAERRRRSADRIGIHLRRLGDLPTEPDADRETVRELLARVGLALADDKRDQILQRSRQAEEHLAETARTALEEDLPSATQAVLETLLVAPEAGVAPDST